MIRMGKGLSVKMKHFIYFSLLGKTVYESNGKGIQTICKIFIFCFNIFLLMKINENSLVQRWQCLMDYSISEPITNSYCDEKN